MQQVFGRVKFGSGNCVKNSFVFVAGERDGKLTLWASIVL